MKKLLDACHQGRIAPLSERKLIISDFISLVDDAGLMDGPIEAALVKLEGILIH
jgi:hypothetical protein